MKKPKVLSRKVKYKGDWMDIIGIDLQIDGEKYYWEYIIGGDAVIVVPVDGKDVYLVKEYREPWKRVITTVVAGGCKYKTESGRLKQARNELREEIGMDAKKIVKLTQVMHGSRSISTHHIYLATGLFPSPKKPDDGEIIEVEKMLIKKAYKHFLNNEPTTTGCLLAIKLAMEKLKIK